MPDLLLELRSEEIPAKMQESGARELREQLAAALQDAGLAWSAERLFWSPRRVAVVLEGLPECSESRTVERRGPATDAPDKAVAGFCRSAGVERAQLEERQVGERTYFFANTVTGGQPVAECLAEVLPRAVEAVRWPKSMRWEHETFRWVRPLRSILCLLSSKGTTEMIEFTVADITSGNRTRGHPVHRTTDLQVDSVTSYPEQLRAANVIVDAAERVGAIAEFLATVTTAEQQPDAAADAMIEEVANLVEWPEMRYQTIDDEFLELPAALVRTAIWNHQKFIPVYGAGATADQVVGYVVVADHVNTEQHPSIFTGYARVLRARLADARFFWRNDLAAGTARLNERLRSVMFFGALGSVAERVARITALADFVAERLGANRSHARRAAELCKADLASETVGEFPELQGVVGGFLARAENEAPEVTATIAAHYSLLDSASVDSISATEASLIVADHIDKIYGLFAAGERPTGSRDPYALRRAAATVIRALLIRNSGIPLGELLQAAASGYEAIALPQQSDAAAAATGFMLDRLHGMLRNGEVPAGVMAQAQVRHDEVAAVAAHGDEDDPVRFVRRVNDLSQWLTSDSQAENLLTAYHRASNILVDEGVTREAAADVPDENLYQHPAEHTLAGELTQADATIQSALGADDFPQAIAAVSNLRQSIDTFFEEVTVNCDDAALRQNRLRLLSRLRSVMERVAAFSELEGR